MQFELLRKRSEIIRTIRAFFDNRNYLEIDTPVLSPHLIPESTIEIFKTERVSPYTEDKEEMYLTPSPEIWMKKALSKGSGNIYQITKSFRNSEQRGNQHNNEFTMMEWYTVNADYMDSLGLMEELLSVLYLKYKTEIIKPPVTKISIKEAFLKNTGINLENCRTERKLIKEIRKNNIEINPDYSWEEAFNAVFLAEVEPELPKDRPVALLDYPQQIPCLAKSGDGGFYERWELYINGIETANCYTEETDKETVDRFFKTGFKEKADSAVPHNVDFSYTDLFYSFPECSGAAVGIDRLVMAAAGIDDIKDILSFIF